MQPSNLKHERGAAIIYAMLLVIIAASLSTLIVLETRLSSRATLALLTLEKASDTAQQLVAVAKLELTKKNSLLPQYLKANTPNQQVSGELTDAQAKFNINNLLVADYIPLFKRLIKAVDPDLAEAQIDAATTAIVQWLATETSDKHVQYVVSVSELKIIPEFSAELYTKIAPYLVALPKITPINVNSAPKPLLISLSENMSAEKLNNILTLREQQRFSSTQDFLQRAELATDPLAKLITVDSQYFILRATVTIAQHTNTFYTLLERRNKGTKQHLQQLWQSFNIL